ncbi:acyl-CoA dehydrogenase family protein [Maricurvus nonylphenolicus]|uniref:acyl-CoA dehydrogenase family protein n=1 Tax=Maricurvus nonylphenolicus TaxID=1008307 RepID=UPI0036F3BBA0
MTHYLSADQEYLKETVRKFLSRNLDPYITDYERRGHFPFEIMKDIQPFGMVGGILDEAHGGMDLSFTEWTLLVEEAGYHWASLRAAVNNASGVSLLLRELGTKSQKQEYLEPVMKCERQGWVGITEPDHGSNVAGIETRAVKQGNSYIITGSKVFITFGQWADFGILVAKTFSDTCDGKLSLFIVDKDSSPYIIEPVETMILRSTGTALLSFDNVKVPSSSLLGREGEGLKSILSSLNKGRLNLAAGSVGYAQAALDKSIEYAKTRKQFNKLIGEFQLIQDKIVEMQIRTDASRALTYNAARALDEGKLSRVECSIAKLYATRAGFEVADMAMEVHGGIGYATDMGIERIFRDSKGAMIPEGTSNIQKLIIGRELLGISALL